MEEEQQITSFADRQAQNKRRSAEKKEIAAKEEAAKNIKITPEEISLARETISLMESAAFKAYMIRFEANEIANSLRNAFNKNPLCEHGDTVYRTAFNDGFYKAMLYMQSKRKDIWTRFLDFQKYQTNKESK